MYKTSEKERARKRAWYANAKIEKPEWYAEHVEKKNDYGKEWAKKRSKNLKLRFRVLSRDAFTCQYCGRKAPDVILPVDHVLPVSKGGKTVEDNLVTACQECNLGKSDTIIK